MGKPNRNDPCPCGSGKKYKNCHLKEGIAPGSTNKTYLISAIFAIFIIIAALSLYFGSQPDGKEKPPGPAPAGKVWSPEHGHYH